MKLTKKKAIELHRRLWDWLVQNPMKEKWDWSNWEKNGGDIPKCKNDCFLCGYVINQPGGADDDGNPDCELCPLDWPKGSCVFWDDGGLFNKWAYAKTPKTKKKYAILIRDLPERGKK